MSDPTATPPAFVPHDLYDVGTLLGAWGPDDDQSYGATLDARAYVAAIAAGLRVPGDDEMARQRALHDHAITRALSHRLVGKRVVAFMGGHRLERGSDAYRLVVECARALAAAGIVVISGGGPGAMEAAHLGARLSAFDRAALGEAFELLESAPAFPLYAASDLVRADGSLDPGVLGALHAWQAPAFAVAARWDGGVETIGIPTWLYGHEPPTPLVSAHAKYFENSIREDGLLAGVAKAGVVFAEGSAGTLQEVFQDAAQNHYKSVDDTRSPMVFLDLGEFWTVTRPVRLLLEGVFDDETETILHFVTTVDDAVRAILDAPLVPTPAFVPSSPVLDRSP